MSTNRDELALRKEFLLAQSALQRAQLRYEVVSLRSRATRVTTWISGGITIMSLARTLLSIAKHLRR